MEADQAAAAFKRRYGMTSSPGGREYNEDSCMVRDYTTRRVRQYLCFMAVADGMGGHQAGDAASRVAIDMLQTMLDPGHFESERDFQAKAEDALWKAFSTINSHIYDLGRGSPESRGMGTTLTCGLVNGESAYVAHVGDTRAYLISRQGSRQVTEDHSIVGKMVSEGVLTEQQAQTHEKRNVITHAVGPEPNVEIDILRVPMRPGEVMFLCTDGLYTKVTRDEITRVILVMPDMQAACDRLVEVAVARGADDNVTAAAWRMPVQHAAAPGRRRRAAGAPRGGGLRWWTVALLVLLVLAIGAGIGWGAGSIWYRSKSQKSKTGKAVKTDGTRTNTNGEKAAQAGFKANDESVVNAKSGCYLRKEPGRLGPVIAKLGDGCRLKILSSKTKSMDGYEWYNVEVIDPAYPLPEKVGYVAKDYLSKVTRDRER